MTDEQVERVAKALARKARVSEMEANGFNGRHLNEYVDVCWADHKDRARAAIAALQPAQQEDRIEALEAENARLREALEPFATWADHYRATTHDHYVPECEIDGPGHSLTITLGDFRRARAALGEAQGEPG